MATRQCPCGYLGNPASQNCIAKGDKHVVERRPDGAQYGVCLFEDNRQCEERALLRGQCPAGGIRVAGYDTPAARYCAITGGRNEGGMCTLPGGKSCNAEAYFRGEVTCRD